MAEYRTIITALGQTKLAAAIVGSALTLQSMAVGDANGVGYDPDEEQTALVNSVYSDDLDSVEALAGGVIVVELTIPADQGGFHIRETGLFDDEGDLIAIARIADRYKPLPASGQADELTVRMKLDVGNVGNVNWVVDLTRKQKLDGQLRPDFRSVDSFLNDPPNDATAGDTWIVGNAPTGAWVEHENELAEWSGTGWTFAEPTDWMLVGLADRTDWRWDHNAGPAEWVKWKASTTQKGPVKLADATETVEGAADDVAVTPVGLKAALEAPKPRRAANFQEFETTSRLAVSGIMPTVFSGVLEKVSATSKLCFSATISLHNDTSSYGLWIAETTIDGITKRTAIYGGANSSGGGGVCPIDVVFTGLPLGNLAFTIKVGRSASASMDLIVNPTTTDESAYGSITASAASCYEVEPDA